MTAARRVGSAGLVTATDVSPEMIEEAKHRGAKHGISNMLFEVAAMEKLPFPDNSFDAVTCRYGLMYSADPALAWRECARVVKSGGRVAHMVRGSEESNTMVWTVIRAANNAWGNPISDAEVAQPLRFASKGTLLPFVTAAGLQDGTEQEIEFQPRIKIGVPFWQPLIEINAGEIWNGLAEDERQPTEDAVVAAHRTSTGRRSLSLQDAPKTTSADIIDQNRMHCIISGILAGHGQIIQLAFFAEL